MLVRLSENIPGFSYGDFTLANGGDLRFYDAAGNMLSHEIDTWNESGVSTAWVKVPTLNASTKITAKYGCSGTLPFVNPKDVWDANYLGVWHLGAASGVSTQGDSTGMGHDFAVNANNSDGVASGANGVVGRSAATGVRSDGKGCFFQSDSADKLFSGHSAFTVEAWTWQDDHDATESSKARYILRKYDDGGTMAWNLQETGGNATPSDNGKYLFQFYNSSDALKEILIDGSWAKPSRADWNHSVSAWDGGTGVRNSYLNGSQLSSYSASDSFKGRLRQVATASAKLCLGNIYGGLSQFPGKLDEVRISKVARSSEWIKATYDTIKNNAAFTAYSDARENKKLGLYIIVR